MKRLCIQMFEGLKITGGPDGAAKTITGRPGLLLAYLALRPGKTQERDALIDDLWRDDAVSRENLRTMLTRLRKELKDGGFSVEDAFEDSDHRMGLKADAVETDVGAYRAAKTAADRATDNSGRRKYLEQARALYKGPFLPGFRGDWADPLRIGFETEQNDVLTRLSAICEETGDKEAAIGYAEQAFQGDGCNQKAACVLMRLCLQREEYTKAESVYRRLNANLKKEFDLLPSEEARRLAQQARNRQRLPLSRRPAAPVFPAEDSAPLPLPLTRFFGREAEIANITRLLTSDGRRLVTLTGLGGSGKTRLALEAGHRLRGAWNKRVFFVDLVSLEDGNFLLETIARALQPGAAQLNSPLDYIAGLLGDSAALLILDNFEGLLPSANASPLDPIPAGTSAVLALLQRIPALSALVTSRERLDAQGEVVFPIAPLPVPADGEALDDSAGVQLFTDRAQAAKPDFAPDANDAALLAAICRRLEGIPLALVLAAAWLESRTLTEIDTHLKQRFYLLVSQHKDVPLRQRALWKTVEWSFDLLTPELQRVFLRLSVFRGGWTLEAANSVCETPDALPALRKLQKKSLIDRAVTGESTRYTMLETLRDFAAAHKIAEEKTRDAALHAAYFRELAAQAEPHLIGPDSLLWLNKLEADHDNLLFALDWLFAQKEYVAVMEIASNLLRYWERRGYTPTGQRYLEEALAHCPENTYAQSRALWARGQLLQRQGEVGEAAKIFRESIIMAEGAGDSFTETLAMLALGHNALTRSDYTTARLFLMESLTRFKQDDDQKSIARACHSLGSLNVALRRVDEAEDYFKQSLQRWREIGDRLGEARTLLNLAAACSDQPSERTKPMYLQSLAVFEEFRDFAFCAVAQQALGNIALRNGAEAEAQSLLESSIDLARQAGFKDYETLGHHYIGDLRFYEGDLAAAEVCYRQSLPQLVHYQNLPWRVQSLHAFARLAWKKGGFVRVVWLLSAIDALCLAHKVRVEAVLAPDGDVMLEETRAALGEEEFTRHWDAGQGASWEEAVAFALEEETAEAP